MENEEKIGGGSWRGRWVTAVAEEERNGWWWNRKLSGHGEFRITIFLFPSNSLSVCLSSFFFPPKMRIFFFKKIK